MGLMQIVQEIGDPAVLTHTLMMRNAVREDLFEFAGSYPVTILQVGDRWWCFGFDAILVGKMVPQDQTGEAIIAADPNNQMRIPIAFSFVTTPLIDDVMRTLIKIENGPELAAMIDTNGRITVYSRREVEGATPILPKDDKETMQA